LIESQEQVFGYIDLDVSTQMCEAVHGWFSTVDYFQSTNII
jgi:hypothetical protein